MFVLLTGPQCPESRVQGSHRSQCRLQWLDQHGFQRWWVAPIIIIDTLDEMFPAEGRGVPPGWLIYLLYRSHWSMLRWHALPLWVQMSHAQDGPSSVEGQCEPGLSSCKNKCVLRILARVCVFSRGLCGQLSVLLSFLTKFLWFDVLFNPRCRIYAWFSSSILVYIYELPILSCETKSQYA